MKKKIEIEVPEGTVAEWKEINGVTALVLGDEKDNRPVTERIKTFEDAVKATGMTIPLDDNQLSYLPKDVVAYMKLRIIAAALNGLTEDTIDEFPKFIKGEHRWYPCFYLYKHEEIERMDEEKKEMWLRGSHYAYDSNCGLAYSQSCNEWANSFSYVASRLAVKSEELAEYFGKQFIDIWANYLIAKE